MDKTRKLKRYAELFRRHMQRYLAPGIHVRTVIYPVAQEGAVFEFTLNRQGITEEIVERTRPTVGTVLSELPQRFIGGHSEGVRFGGTNLFLEGNRILVVKGEDETTQWTGNAVINDVARAVSTSMAGKRA